MMAWLLFKTDTAGNVASISLAAVTQRTSSKIFRCRGIRRTVWESHQRTFSMRSLVWVLKSCVCFNGLLPFSKQFTLPTGKCKFFAIECGLFWMFIFLYVGSIFSKFLFRQLSEFSSVNWWLISSYIPRKKPTGSPCHRWLRWKPCIKMNWVITESCILCGLLAVLQP